MAWIPLSRFCSDKLVLASCVAGYFLLSGIVTLLDYMVFKGSAFVVKDKAGDVFFGVKMNKGESHAVMTFRRGAETQEYRVEIDKLFDVEGVLMQSPTLAVFETNFSAFLSKKDKKKD
jgi:hypothetical protein